ncbi:MAG: thioredoxin [Chloroflexota bacterium]|nr:thioredoxin [Chloroflexota bacterium]
MSNIIEVTDQDFQQQVIEQSHSRPVVVDFWAPWCAPCRMIGPVLERLATEANGAWVLAKLNVDHNQQTAARYGIQGIPAVKGFKDGQVVAEFVGAQPEPNIRRFIDELVPGAAENLVGDARRLEAGGDLGQAESLYQQALLDDPNNAGALLGLGRVLFNLDRMDESLAALQRVPQAKPERAEAESWIAKANFRQSAELSGGEVDARRRLAANPDDLQARLDLAAALAAKESYREALEGLLEVIRRDRGTYRENARKNMLSIFDVLGEEHTLTQEYQQQLAIALY